MTDRLTEAEIAEARRVCEGATPGEYRVKGAGVWVDQCKVASILAPDAVSVFASEKKRANAAFFALAHSLLPRLLDEVTELREQMATIELAAHMPADYEYGLPSWINQKLYGRLLELTDKDGGWIRRTEDVEELDALREENRQLCEERDRLLVLVACYQNKTTTGDFVRFCGHSWDFTDNERWHWFERTVQEYGNRGRALVQAAEKREVGDAAE